MKNKNIKIKEVKLKDRPQKIQIAINSNKIFRVDFTKKDSSFRVMICRGGVKKGVTGKGLNYDPKEYNNAIVFDMENDGFRTIPIERVHSLTYKKTKYKFI
tara:strand:- start:135 stop:437 length:303 start_codon:yes stop_codon:yes gene_type:complete